MDSSCPILIGHVTEAHGLVFATDDHGHQRVLEPGSPVYLNETVVSQSQDSVSVELTTHEIISISGALDISNLGGSSSSALPDSPDAVGNSNLPTSSMVAVEAGTVFHGKLPLPVTGPESPFHYHVLQSPEAGSLTIEDDGSYVFEAETDFQHLGSQIQAKATFTYEADDESGHSYQGQVHILIFGTGVDSTPTNAENTYFHYTPSYIDQNINLSHSEQEATPAVQEIARLDPVEQIRDEERLASEESDDDDTGTAVESIDSSSLTGSSTSDNQAFSYALPANVFTDLGSERDLEATQADGSALPPWLSFDPQTQTFSGEPDGPVESIQVKITARSTDTSDSKEAEEADEPSGLGEEGEVGGDPIEMFFEIPIPFNPINTIQTAQEAVISGQTTGAVFEDGGSDLVAQGTLSIIDPDPGQAAFISTSVSGSYGSLSITSLGEWTYSLNNTQADIQSLGSGVTLTETLSVEAVDGTTQNITVTITGTNDAANISGTTTGTFAEEDASTLNATGSLSITDIDTGEALFSAATITGSYGSLTIDASGSWSYNADNSQIAIQSLGSGDTLTETITIQSVDGTTQDIVITVSGTNDAAVISGMTTGAVTEDAAATLNATGNLTITDVDTGEAVFTTATITGSYGSLTINPSGSWSYNADNSQTAIQSLGSGDTLTETLTVQSVDGTTQDIVITINGVNDAAIISGMISGAVSEEDASTLNVTGTLTITDTDAGEDVFTAATVTGSYGSLTIDASGSWSYDADNSQTVIQSLGSGDTLTETLIIQSVDGTTQSIVITINGTNDAAVISGTTTGAFAEDDASTLNASGNLTISDVDTGEAVFTAATVTGSYGSLTISTSGSWNYNAENSQTAIQSLGSGDTLTETLTVQSVDGTTQDIVITINGVNDAAIISGTTTGTVSEEDAATLNETGTLSITDIDAGEDVFTAATVTGSYGSLTIDASGSWSYDADNSQTAIQSLGSGDTLTETLTIQSVDGTTQSIVITINGTNDTAVISGTTTGAFAEDDASTLNTTGSLTISDVDTGEAVFTAATITGTYGSLTIDASGSWSYDADNSQTVIQSLGSGATLTETLTVQSVDGTTQNIVITINGTNDAAVISGATTGEVTEQDASTLNTTGSLSVTDTDSGEASFTAATVTGSYGSLTIDASGSWSYEADNSQTAIQALGSGDTLTETLSVQSLDGTTENVVITINGINNAAIISGTTTGTVSEEDAATLNASGTLTITDTDAGEDVFTAATVTGSYGSLTIDASGSWSYDADNSQTVIQSLGSGDTLTETLTIQSVDGTTQSIVITINGTNDAAVISGTTTGTVTEEGASTLNATGSLTVTDTDSGEASFTAATVTGSYGSLTIDASGSWSYEADNSQTAVQSLGSGDTLTETLSIQSFDGTTQNIVITINGTNDAAVISGVTTGAVIEDGASTLNITGSLSVTDADSGEASFSADTVTGSYGSLTINASGSWSYDADNSQTAIQSLGYGDTLTETLTIQSVDGTTQNIMIIISGVNDAAVISGTTTGAVTEDGASTLNTTGSLSVTDTDSGEASFTANTVMGSYGSLTIDASGSWSYEADNSQTAIQSLGSGNTLTETLSIQSFDGTTQNIVLTINGTNDVAVISGTSTGAVTENDASTLLTTGSLSVSDTDAGEASFSVATVTGSYGSLTIDASGNWSYEADNSQTAVQALGGSNTLTETLSVQSFDGTTENIVITINGLNNAAVISGTTTGAISEDGASTLNISGALTITDTDTGEDVFTAATVTGSYGSLTIDASGSWSYDADNSQTVIQSLGSGDTLTETLSIQSVDGTTQNIVITINGTNDAAVISGTTTGTVTEEGASTLNATGSLTVTDTDSGEASFTAATVTGSYGSLTIDASGSWSYEADNSQTAVQSLGSGDTLTETLSIQSFDGTTQNIVITINGTNDAAVISGVTTGAVIEDGASTLNITGSLSVTDADSGEASFSADTVTGSYGSLTINASGSWSYDADNSQTAIQSLGYGDTLTETLTIQSVDGTTQNIMIIISGVNDAAVISGTTTGAVTEDGASTLNTTGSLSVTDTDSGEALLESWVPMVP